MLQPSALNKKKENKPRVVEKNSDDPKLFLLDYMNSSKYKERLLKQGYKNPEQVVEKRTEKVKAVKTVEQNGKPNLLEQFLLKAKGVDYSTMGSAYLQSKNKIIIDKKTDSEKKIISDTGHNDVRVHEMTHAEQAGYKMNKNDEKELFNRQKEYALNSDFSKKERDNIKKNLVTHDLKPEENKADINALRYIMKKSKIYDAGKEDVQKKHLDKVKPGFIKNRLMKNYKEKDLLWLMNNIAENRKKPEENEKNIS